MSIAILRGDGLAYAEELIKGSNGYEVDEDVACETDLSGLSCRWNPIPSKKGKILTILVSSRKGQSAYLDFITALSKILPDGIEGSNPVNVDFATYKSISQLLKEERKLHASVFSLKFIARALEIVWLVLVFAHKFPALFFDAAQYANSMRTHSDFRKFDGILRMVLDCGLEQIVQIEAYLKKSMKTASFSLEPPGPTAH